MPQQQSQTSRIPDILLFSLSYLQTFYECLFIFGTQALHIILLHARREIVRDCYFSKGSTCDDVHEMIEI